MMETILQWDTSLMHWINNGWSHPVLDAILVRMRNKYMWVPLYILALSWIVINLKPWRSLLTIVCITISIFASDTISSKLIKFQVQRPRPCHEMKMDPPVIQRVECGIGYSFTSSHAANHFCFAAFLTAVFGSVMRRWSILWWLWAASISIAQVYVGLHYPLDIFFGGLLGVIIGTSMGIVCRPRSHPVS